MSLLVLCTVLGVAGSAHASNYIVYLHGRSQTSWPAAAYLGAPAGWSQVTFSYNGSASLGDSATQTTINNTIATYCGSGNQCVLVCYSEGCPRMLLSFKQLKDQSRYPAGILWTEAAASSAGGSEASVFATKWYVKLIAKIFGLESAAPIDYDIQPNTMLSGTYANIQNQATAPIYHLAGSADMCVKISILWLFHVKLCGNGQLPGGDGDGLIPVHSAAGYSDAGAHASTNDGSGKFVFRAYEQTPLYALDHLGVVGPMVIMGSLRLSIGKTPNCPNRPAVDTGLPDASIIYDDGDGAVTEESSPLNTLILCGSQLWNGQQPVYGTCLSGAGCCTAFSNGSAGGCSCGETLCKAAQFAGTSYYTTADCSGTEYSQATGLDGYQSYNGLGMAGVNTTTITARSARRWSDGRCAQLLRETCYGSLGNCCNDFATTQSIPSVRVVYRPGGSDSPPAGSGPGIVVSSTTLPHSECP
ncbi:MAG TPA: hypothetical protein VH165_30530 [Kofleriaceae bacterium]|nr:hypothetical protein [Kofleriaceae bacterium]